MQKLIACLIMIGILTFHEVIGQDTLVVTQYFGTGGDHEKTAYVIQEQDTLSSHIYYNDEWVLSILYKKKLVYCRSLQSMRMIYYNYANKGERYTLVAASGKGDSVVAEYLGREQDGAFNSYQNGQLVYSGKYWNGNRWGFWYECMYLPPHKCGSYFVFGRGHMSNREIIWSISEFYLVCFYALSFPASLVLAYLLGRKRKLKTFIFYLGLWLTTSLLSLPLAELSWALRVLLYYPYFGLMVYIPIRLFSDNTTKAFRIVGTLFFMVQLLITIFVILLINTDFSH